MITLEETMILLKKGFHEMAINPHLMLHEDDIKIIDSLQGKYQDMSGMYLQTISKTYATWLRKSHDYGGDGDPFKNLRKHGLKGIAMRIDDKIARLDTFLEKGILMVNDENVDNTLEDIINYCIIFKAYLKMEVNE